MSQDSSEVLVFGKNENEKRKQTFINHYFGSVPTLDEIGLALIRTPKGTIDLVSTVKRLEG